MNDLTIAPDQYTSTGGRERGPANFQLPFMDILKNVASLPWGKVQAKTHQTSHTILVEYVKQESSAKKVVKEVIRELEITGFLEAVHGFVGEEGCNIIAIADRLSTEQRYKIWDVKWNFIERYPNTGIDIRLLERRGRPMSTVFQAGDSPYISLHLTTK